MARIFTAIDLPDDVRIDLDEHLDVLRSVRGDLRWVRAENLHLTVRFLGECGDREVDRQIEHWTQRCENVDAFDARLAGAGCFPQTWRAKVLYAGVECDETGFARLAGPEQTPHVTIARSRELADLTGAVHELADYRSASWRVESVTMYESFIGRGRAPRYEPIETFALRQNEDAWWRTPPAS